MFAAGLSAEKGNIEEAADQGLKFFADLNRKGNFVPIIGDANSVADGRTPILIRWDYLALGDRDRQKGTTRIEVITPRAAVVAGVYVQAISVYAPHPNAARLWMEYLYSDEAQLAWLKGHCYPIRFADLMRSGKVPIEFRGRPQQPSHEGHDVDHPVFPTLKDQEKARDTITNGWDDIVGVKMQCLPNQENLVPMS